MPHKAGNFEDHEPSSRSLNQILPDLSLHISPPNSAPSSISTGTTNNAESTFDVWQREDQQAAGLLKSHSDSSIRDNHHHHDSAKLELSLAHLNSSISTTSEAESPWRRNYFFSSNREADDHINHGVSIKPIRGIPVYSNAYSSSFPSPNSDQYYSRKLRDSNRFCNFYESSSPCSSSSPSTFLNRRANGSIIAGGRDHHGLEPLLPRFNGITVETVVRPNQQFHYLDHQQRQHHHQYYHHQYGIIGANSDIYNGFRSSFTPTLQNRRNMRAPRMRWTSSLHARFVHAVELLGGHESKALYLSLLSLSPLH